MTAEAGQTTTQGVAILQHLSALKERILTMQESDPAALALYNQEGRFVPPA